MLFKDQAQQLVSRWETFNDYDNLDTLAAQTAVALASMPEVPDEVIRALDCLLSYDSKKQATWIIEVVRYLRSLATDKLRLAVDER